MSNNKFPLGWILCIGLLLCLLIPLSIITLSIYGIVKLAEIEKPCDLYGEGRIISIAKFGANHDQYEVRIRVFSGKKGNVALYFSNEEMIEFKIETKYAINETVKLYPVCSLGSKMGEEYLKLYQTYVAPAYAGVLITFLVIFVIVLSAISVIFPGVCFMELMMHNSQIIDDNA